MTASPTATRKDIDDVLGVLGTMMSRIDSRFLTVEAPVTRLSNDFNGLKLDFKEQRDTSRRIFTHLDSVEKNLELNDEERLVMGHQLERLDKWVHDLARHIDYELPV